MIPVEHYGFHQDGNLVYLLEQNSARCLTPGLSALPSPFELVRRDKLPCPHMLRDPAPGSIVRHPLVKAMAPVPSKGAAFWLPSVHRPAVLALTQMTRVTGFVPWTMTNPIQKLAAQLMLTNAAPLVITGYEPRDYLTLETLLTLPRIRTVILCGPLRVQGAAPIRPLKRLKHDWPAIGAAMTERYVRSCL